jgi:hypothetical protein
LVLPGVAAIVTSEEEKGTPLWARCLTGLAAVRT